MAYSCLMSKAAAVVTGRWFSTPAISTNYFRQQHTGLIDSLLTVVSSCCCEYTHLLEQARELKTLTGRQDGHSFLHVERVLLKRVLDEPLTPIRELNEAGPLVCRMSRSVNQLARFQPVYCRRYGTAGQ
jgi:hypothetical protein